MSCWRITILLLAGVGTLSAAPQDQGGMIGGVVLNAFTNAPIRKAAVGLTEVEANAFARAITDGSGRFEFSQLPAGRFRVIGFRDGFTRVAYGAKEAGQPGVLLRLGRGQAKQGLVLRLTPLSAITGTVVDEEGDPVPMASVELLSRTWDRGKPHVIRGSGARTDDRGEYRIPDVYPGKHYVRASLRFRRALRSRPVGTAGSSQSREDYGVQFYPGTDRLSSAALLDVGPGKDIDGIDFRLQELRTVALKGRVLLPDGVPPGSSVMVQAFPQDVPDSINASRSMNTNGENSEFDTADLAPGNYRLVASFSANGKQYSGVRDVELTEANGDGITVPLYPCADLSGSVTVEGPGAQNYRHFEVSLTPGDYLLMQRSQRPTRTATNDDLSYTLKGVPPGIWDIGVRPIPKGGYVKAMLLGDQDVLTEDMVIGPDTKGPLKIVLSTAGARVEGDIQSEGDPRQGQQEIVLLAPEGKFSRVLSFFRLALADEKGHFEIDGVMPGAYRLYAFEEIAARAWQDPGFLNPFRSRGEAVELREGQAATVNPKLIPVGAR